MTVAELITELKKFPEETDVYYVDDEHGLLPVNTVRESGISRIAVLTE